VPASEAARGCRTQISNKQNNKQNKKKTLMKKTRYAVPELYRNHTGNELRTTHAMSGVRGLEKLGFSDSEIVLVLGRECIAREYITPADIKRSSIHELYFFLNPEG
jgi:hypothetical protein